MFVIKKPETFPFAALIPVAGEPPRKLRLIGVYRTQEELAALREATGEDGAGLTNAELVGRIVVGWPEDAADVPYSKEAMNELLRTFPAAPVAIARAYSNALIEGLQGN